MNGSHWSQLAMEKLLTVKDVASILGVSTSSVYRLVERRMIGFHKLPCHLRFDRKDIEGFLARRTVKPIDEYEYKKNRQKLVGRL